MYCPKGPSRIDVLTMTVNTTPKISITTCIVVELCAGSTSSFFKNNGNIAPRHILLNTIKASADVIAMVSGRGVRKITARKNPAAERRTESAQAILNSRLRNCFCVLSFNVPRARPRITILFDKGIIL